LAIRSRPRSRAFLGVAALVLGGKSAQVHIQELRAQRPHLLARGGANVVRLHHGAQPSRGGDRLQPRNSSADHKDPRRSNGSRSGHQHGEEARQRVCGQDHGLIASNRGHRRQRVHRLRARDARNQLDGEERDPRLDGRKQRGRVVQWPQKSNHYATRLDLSLVVGRGRVHHGQNVGRAEQRRAVGPERRPGLGVSLVSDARLHSRAGFHRNLKAIGNQLLDGVGKQRNTGLSYGCFLHNSKAQDISSKPVRLARFICPSRAGCL
jgi:hypothetical protein